MKNVTITLDEEVAQWVRIWAAKRQTSVSRLVGEMLHKRMLEDQEYETLMKQHLSAEPKHLKQVADHYLRRDELHDR